MIQDRLKKFRAWREMSASLYFGNWENISGYNKPFYNSIYSEKFNILIAFNCLI
jgi:hypothetical protein